MERASVVIVGGGIIGMATAYQITRAHGDKSVIVLEKEDHLCEHQTGRNSGVLHSGIYYRPDSLKAINCRAGRASMVDFCRAEGIDHDVCGKVIVAVDEQELPALEQLYKRGQANGVECEVIDPERLKALEPHVAGVRAIHVKEAGIVDYRQVTERLRQHVETNGGRVVLSANVVDIAARDDEVVVTSRAGEFRCDYLVNCAGLQCDRVTLMGGALPEAKIVPFRGEYYQLQPEATHLVNNLIYPVPDPKFPFLGVHFTRMIDGSVECGPNAVLAFAREGYRKRDINVRDLFESLTYPGFLKMATQYWRIGLGEVWRSLSKRAFVRALQRLVPEIQAEQLERAPAGVRAQAVGRDGAMIDDFLIQQSERVVNVGNAPSPAATASLSIGATIVEHLATRFE